MDNNFIPNDINDNLLNKDFSNNIESLNNNNVLLNNHNVLLNNDNIEKNNISDNTYLFGNTKKKENHKITNYICLLQKDYISFKKKHREWYIVLASIAIVLWFRGITGILDVFFIYNNSILGNIIIILIAVIIFALDDYSLSEIFTPREESKNNNQYSRNAAVATSTSSFMTLG